ncbi:hypothetical protein [Kutzneria sp. NPDC052558]|uniref:hypothetical protein n=1 Tax=Kutzneria sp. NPDC052558 TaxID=3364121 RepID=UPI0037C53687
MSDTETMWAPPDDGRPPQRPDRKPMIAFLIVLVITLLAAAAMGGYLLGLRTAQSEQAALPSSIAPTTTSSAPATTTTAPTTTTDTTTTTTTMTVAVGTVRNATPAGSPVVLNVGYGVNLDSTQPNWDVVPSSDPTYFTDLRFDTQDTVTSSGRGFAQTQPSSGYADCAAATAYTPLLDINQILAGGAYCTTSPQGRFALVVFHPAVGGQLTFDLTVWEKTP